MAKVTIHLAPNDMMRAVYFDKKVTPTVRAEFHRYTTAGQFTFDEAGEAGADEAFDLTNNPCRQEEREQVYGRGRSVSVGDVIEVDNEKFLCLSFGWDKL